MPVSQNRAAFPRVEEVEDTEEGPSSAQHAGNAPQSSPREANLRWLLAYLSSHRGAVLGALLSGALGGLTLAFEPYLVGLIIDHLRSGMDIALLLNDIAALLVLSLVTVAAFYGQRHFSGVIGYAVTHDIRKDFFYNLLVLDKRFYDQYATGDLISRMYSDQNMIWRLLALTFSRIGSATMAAMVSFVLLVSVNASLTLAVYIVIAITTAMQLRAGAILVRIFERVQQQAGVLSAFVQDTFSGVQTLKTFGKVAAASRTFAKENREYRRRWLYFRRWNEPIGMLPQAITQLTTGIVLLYGGVLTVRGDITLGNLAQFFFYLALIRAVLLQIGMIYQRLQQTRGALRRLTPLLSQPAIRNPNADTASDGWMYESNETEPRHISFQDVSLTLDGARVLAGISFEIPAGQITAFVGPTGSGKTLLVNLLARVMDPDSGRVCVDGVDVRHWELSALRRSIAYVPQTTFLFSQELQDNLRMGQSGLSEGELLRALEVSHLAEELPQFPQGLATRIGEKGVLLSGGQKQRVAIARALVRKPAILVLDDALSSVDTRTAAEILRDLRQFLRTRTSLVIAHRIATVKDADHIFVLNHGRIVESGNHDDLLAKDGLYARMVERELREGRQPDALA